MVFRTDGIPMLVPGTHYIKRMAGVPGDEISIDAPNLLVNGKELMEPDPVARKVRKMAPYDVPPYDCGYIPPNTMDGRFLKTPGETYSVGPHRYLGLGDNSANSFDGRYWGTVPESNLIGPAFMVYWPLSVRWGLAR